MNLMTFMITVIINNMITFIMTSMVIVVMTSMEKNSKNILGPPTKNFHYSNI